MRTLKQLKTQVKSNADNGRFAYEGMTSAEIGRYNRALMFGDNDEGFNQEEFEAVTK